MKLSIGIVGPPRSALRAVSTWQVLAGKGPSARSGSAGRQQTEPPTLGPGRTPSRGSAKYAQGSLTDRWGAPCSRNETKIAGAALDGQLAEHHPTEPWALARGPAPGQRESVRFSPRARALTGTALSGVHRSRRRTRPTGLSGLSSAQGRSKNSTHLLGRCLY